MKFQSEGSSRVGGAFMEKTLSVVPTIMPRPEVEYEGALGSILMIKQTRKEILKLLWSQTVQVLLRPCSKHLKSNPTSYKRSCIFWHKP